MIEVGEHVGYIQGVKEALRPQDPIKASPEAHSPVSHIYCVGIICQTQTVLIVNVLPVAELGRDPATDVVSVVENVPIALHYDLRLSVIHGLQDGAIEPLSVGEAREGALVAE